MVRAPGQLKQQGFTGRDNRSLRAGTADRDLLVVKKARADTVFHQDGLISRRSQIHEGLQHTDMRLYAAENDILPPETLQLFPRFFIPVNRKCLFVAILRGSRRPSDLRHIQSKPFRVLRGHHNGDFQN